MPKKDSIIPLSGLLPLRDIEGRLPLLSKNDDKSDADTATLDRCEEWFPCTYQLEKLSQAWFELA